MTFPVHPRERLQSRSALTLTLLAADPWDMLCIIKHLKTLNSFLKPLFTGSPAQVTATANHDACSSALPAPCCAPCCGCEPLRLISWQGNPERIPTVFPGCALVASAVSCRHPGPHCPRASGGAAPCRGAEQALERPRTHAGRCGRERAAPAPRGYTAALSCPRFWMEVLTALAFGTSSFSFLGDQSLRRPKEALLSPKTSCYS